MNPARIRCKVFPGMVGHELYVQIDAGGASYSTYVDEGEVVMHEPLSIEGTEGRLRVRVLEKANDHYLVDLPVDTTGQGMRIFVPREMVARDPE